MFIKNLSTLVAMVVITVSIATISTGIVWARSNDRGIAQNTEPMMVRTVSTTISSGNAHSLAITDDGTLWAWGSNRYGQLGDSTIINQHYPIRIMEDVVAVAAGSTRSLAIRSDGSLWSWGAYRLERLGSREDPQPEPEKIMENVIAVAAGSSHALAIKNDRSLWVWGGNFYGQLGIGDDSNPQRTPIRMMEDVVAVAAGRYHSMALQANGSLWTWGDNEAANLGDGTRINRFSPVMILDNVIAISDRVAIRDDGSLWAWGLGVIGDGTTGPGLTTAGTLSPNEPTSRVYPARIMDDIIYVSNERTSTAIRSDGSLWAWGASNRIGAGYTCPRTRQLTPMQIMDDIAIVSTSGNHTLAVKNDGSLWAWGSNSRGQIGDSSYVGMWEVRYIPVHVMDNIMLPTWEYITYYDADAECCSEAE